MARYKLHCIGASGNSCKLALYMSCAGLDWEPVGIDFAGGRTRDSNETRQQTTIAPRGLPAFVMGGPPLP
jgi:hypothetical protein